MVEPFVSTHAIIIKFILIILEYVNKEIHVVLKQLYVKLFLPPVPPPFKIKETNIQPNTLLSTNVNILIYQFKEDIDSNRKVCFRCFLCIFCI